METNHNCLNKKICLLLVRDPDCSENLMNDILYEVQQRLYAEFPEGELSLAFIYGDRRTCIHDFGQTPYGEVLYLDVAAQPVSQVQLFIMTDAWLRSRPGCDEITWVAIRESDYGMNREDTLWFGKYFTDERSAFPCRAILCDNSRKDDVVTRHYKSCGKDVLTWKDMDLLISRIRG